MTQNEELQLSGWWSVATIAFLTIGVAVVIARLIGPTALDNLILFTLMGIFLVGGVLLGLLLTQAIGASQRWNLLRVTEEEAPLSTVHHREPVAAPSESDTLSGNAVDPFYEILKQNRGANRAA